MPALDSISPRQLGSVPGKAEPSGAVTKMVQEKSMLDLADLVKSFGGFQVLKGVSLNVRQGEAIALLGPSGCGKTTTLRLIAGFEQPDAGSVSIGGRDVTYLPPQQRDIGMVFQNYALFPHMVLSANISFGLRMQRRPQAEIERRVKEVLDLVRLSDFGDRYPSQLSGGQQQRGALARALITNPKVLLMDEPLGALDKNLREEMQFELRRLQQQLGITSVLVTHDQEEALTLADRIAVMSKGSIVQIGSPTEVYERPQSRFAAEFIGTANLWNAEVTALDGRGGAQVKSCDGDGFTFQIPAQELAVGDRVTIAVRPERLRLEPAGPADGPAGTVISHLFRGFYHSYELGCGENSRPLRVYRQPSSDSWASSLAPGSRVRIAWDPAAVIVLERDR